MEVGSRLALALFLCAACGRVGFDREPEVSGDGDGDADAMPAADAILETPPGDPTGTYAVDPPVVYRCAGGLVNLAISSVDIRLVGETLEVTGSPCLQTGTYAADTGALEASCTLPGTCDEIYTASGEIHGVVTYSASFVGQCLNCVDQAFEVSLVRQP